MRDPRSRDAGRAALDEGGEGALVVDEVDWVSARQHVRVGPKSRGSGEELSTADVVLLRAEDKEEDLIGDLELGDVENKRAGAPDTCAKDTLATCGRAVNRSTFELEAGV